MAEEQEVEAKENVAEELTEWNEVDISPSANTEKVEFEVEGEEEPVKAEAPVTAEKEVPELEGIETKGAEKRIRQLVQQKKEQADLLAKAEQEKQAAVKKAELEAQNEKEKVEKEFKEQTEKILAESNARKA